MDTNFRSTMDAAASKFENGMLASGRDDMLKAFEECKDPIGRLLAAYNLGGAFWASIGDGVNARKFYKIAVEEAENIGLTKVRELLPSIVANACENLMHLSLTYEEYFEWSEKLRKLDPTDDVLRGMVPHIREAQEKGIQWAQTLESIACECYNRNDPSLDRGEYARAVSTYELILRNRKNMRLPREAWSRIIYEYGALAIKVADDAFRKMERSQQTLSISEFVFVAQNARPFVDEYLAANQPDDKIKFLQEHLDRFLESCNKLKDPEEIVAMLNSQGLDMLRCRVFRGALAKFKEAEQICRDIGDEEKLQTCIGNMALAVANTGDTDYAFELLDQKEAICRRIDSHRGLAYTFSNRAAILQSLDRAKEALALAEKSDQLCKQYGLDDVSRQLKPMLDSLRSESEKNRSWISKLLKR